MTELDFAKLAEQLRLVELTAEDAALLRDTASRRLAKLVPGGPMAVAWQRIADAIDAALPPQGAA
jgi:hypothetical protein